jgi:hypothetical protein
MKCCFLRPESQIHPIVVSEARKAAESAFGLLAAANTLVRTYPAAAIWALVFQPHLREVRSLVKIQRAHGCPIEDYKCNGPRLLANDLSVIYATSRTGASV